MLVRVQIRHHGKVVLAALTLIDACSLPYTSVGYGTQRCMWTASAPEAGVLSEVTGKSDAKKASKENAQFALSGQDAVRSCLHGPAYVSEIIAESASDLAASSATKAPRPKLDGRHPERPVAYFRSGTRGLRRPHGFDLGHPWAGLL
jgi:hypothetical protein